MRDDLEQKADPADLAWVAPKLEKLGAMRNVAGSLNAPGNGNSGSGNVSPS